MRRLIIAEDNPFVAAVLREAVAEHGYEICGVAATTQELRTLGERHKPDLAIIDVRLADGSNGIDAAVELAGRIPLGILFVTGVPQQVLDPPAPVGTACLRKPFTPTELIRSLEIVEHIVTTGKRPAKLPSKLYLIPRDRRALPREDGASL